MDVLDNVLIEIEELIEKNGHDQEIIQSLEKIKKTLLE